MYKKIQKTMNIIFQEVTIEDGVEDITIIDELRDGELVESKILKEEYSLKGLI